MNLDDVALPLFCPYCGRKNDRHHGVRGPAVPKDGDVGLCWGCSKVFVFEGGAARLPTATEQAEIDSHPDISLAHAVQRESYRPDEATALVREILADQGGRP